MKRKLITDILGLAAAAGIIVGIFAPLAKVSASAFGFSFGHEFTFTGIAGAEQYFMIGFAILAIVFVLLGMYRMIWIAALGVWLSLLSPYLKHMMPSGEKKEPGMFDGWLDGVNVNSDPAIEQVLNYASELDLGDFGIGTYALLGGLLLIWVASFTGLFKK